MKGGVVESAEREPVEGVYVSLEELVFLRAAGMGFHFLPRQPIQSLLSGRHASRLRGRGLMFEEMRAYVPGDDIRSIDWKATARAGDPFVRVYNEERERPVILVVDQSVSMFFGSRERLKSVTAAHAAALAAWRVIHVGDRVGALVFNDEEHVYIKPQRSVRNAMRILGVVQAFNHRLDAGKTRTTDRGSLDRILEQVAAVAHHDYLIVLITDYEGAGSTTREWVTRIRRHNDIISVAVTDPLEESLPGVGTLVVSDGAMQVPVDTSDSGVRNRYAEATEDKKSRIENVASIFDVPCMFLSTEGEVTSQVRVALGYSPRTRRV